MSTSMPITGCRTGSRREPGRNGPGGARRWRRRASSVTMAVAGAAALASGILVAAAPQAARAQVSAGTGAAAGATAASVPIAAHAARAGSPRAGTGAGMRAACPPARPGYLRCFALYEPQAPVNAAIGAGTTGSASRPRGLSAQDIESAYQLPVSRNPHQTVAVVDAYRTPDLGRYLDAYRAEYRLGACIQAGGCLQIVNQAGKSSPLPASGVGSGWDVETSLDVSMVSAGCPHCRILVVEARTPSYADFAAAEDTAARRGAQVISNSYGAGETGYELPYVGAYEHPGHTIVASAGDEGFTAAQFPADLSDVTAVGGTVLRRAPGTRGWDERLWDTPAGAGGSGCSAYVAKPSWQHDPHCPMRTVADVSAVAWDVPVYDKAEGGWLTVGGTSIAAPLIAAIYGLAGNAATIAPGYEYRHARRLFDIIRGNNDWINGTHGSTCGYDYLCVAKKGYDAPSGLGTPDGTGAF